MRLFRRYDPAEYEFWALATYNAERARGIVHTPEWTAAMAREQERFDAHWKENLHLVPPSLPDPGRRTS